MKYRLEYISLKAVFAFFRSLTPEGRLRWGRAVGRAWYRLDGKHRTLAVRNIVAAFGGDRDWAVSIARRAFENIAVTLAEFASLSQIDLMEGDVSLEGVRHIDEALEKGNGAFLLSAHTGNWELVGSVISRRYPLTVVARPMKNPLSEQLISGARQSGGMEVLGHRNSTRPILKKLAANELIAILLDQSPSPREGVFVPFLGRPVLANFGLALLAAKSGAAVIPTFAVRDRGRKHRVVFSPPVELAHLEDRREEMGVNTARFTAVIEEQVRRYPEQWFWVHNRWKRRPGEGDRVYRP